MTKPKMAPKTQQERTRVWRANAPVAQFNVLVPTETRDTIRAIAEQRGKHPANLVHAWAMAGCPEGSSAVAAERPAAKPAAVAEQRKVPRVTAGSEADDTMWDVAAELSKRLGELTDCMEQSGMNPREFVQELLAHARGLGGDVAVVNGELYRGLEFLSLVDGKRGRDGEMPTPAEHLHDMLVRQVKSTAESPRGKAFFEQRGDDWTLDRKLFGLK